MKQNAMKAEAKQVEAAGRAEYFQSLTLQQRLDRLDARLGKGVGAVKERAKIAKAMALAAETAKPKAQKEPKSEMAAPKAKKSKK